MKTILKLYCFLILSFFSGLAQQISAQKDHYLGGTLNLSIEEAGLNRPGVSATNAQNSFSLELQLYKLWERPDNQAFGIGLQWSTIKFDQNSGNGSNSNQFGQIGLTGFWRIYLLQPSTAIQLWVQPQIELGYGRQNNQSANGQAANTKRNYRISLGVLPGMLWQFAERWRLNIALGGIQYGFDYNTTDEQLGSNYKLGLDVQLNPASAIFGIEYQL